MPSAQAFSTHDYLMTSITASTRDQTPPMGHVLPMALAKFYKCRSPLLRSC